MARTIANSNVRFDILRVPLLGRFLLWKHSRTALQLIIFVLAAGIIVDGLLGSQLAARNFATVAAWVHYRGLVVLVLLLAGNLFCAACPFMLPRKLAKWIGQPKMRWPKFLRNKWLALVCLVAIVYSYELFDLWATPWWTAWLTIAYFATAFVLEAFFTRNSFCMYVCPLGTFNFLYSTVSPLQITSRNLHTCHDCKGKECLNGSASQQGCQLELFVPTINSNLDCTFCLDCAKACPYDNVALTTRPPGDELFKENWPHRLDLALMAILASVLALVNAFGMTPPVYQLESWLANLLGIQHESVILGLIYVGGLALPVAIVYLAAWIAKQLSKSTVSLNRMIMRYAYGFVPMGFATWIAHYLYHFVTGGMTILPVTQTFFANTLGVPLFGQPNWKLATLFTPGVTSIQMAQMVIIVVGLLGGVMVAMSAAQRAQKSRQRALLEVAPWLILLVVIAFTSISIFTLPMEMRGSVLGG
ncbi:MAG: hypothetical protein U0175_29420 [Caldilineaceae bacterium]